MWVVGRMVPANKEHPNDRIPGAVPDCRPVNIGNAERRLITRAYFDEDLKDTYIEILGPVQNGCIPGGISITALGAQIALDARPGFGIVKGDIKNGYNEVKRESVLKAMRASGKLGHTLAFMHAIMKPNAYIGLGAGTRMTTAPFKCCEGQHQGAIESSWLFSLAVNDAFQRHNERLAEHGGAMMAIMDDNYTIGNPEHIFESMQLLKEDLAKVGLELQPSKSKCYISEENRNEEWDRLRGDTPNETMVDDEGITHYGLSICNIPMGSKGYVKTYLDKKKSRIIQGFDLVSEALDPGRYPHPEIPTRQMQWILTFACLQFQGDYWLRHIDPRLTDLFAKGIDEGIYQLVEKAIGIRIASFSDIARERMRLPLRNKGCGLREAADRAYAQFMGAVAQCIPQLIDRIDKEGNIIPGRLNIECVIEYLGEGSFNCPVKNPWEHMLQRDDQPQGVASAIRETWSQLTKTFQDIRIQTQTDQERSYLLTQEVEQAGFHHDGTQPSSVTRAITKEIETARGKQLRKKIVETLPKDDFERQAYLNCGRMSYVFLHSPPDHIGYMENETLRMGFARYLGQPCPVMAPMVGRFFGNAGQKLDKYGRNLAAANLPGQGFRTLHNAIQDMMVSIMKVAGIQSHTEAANFLNGKIGEPYISNYINHITEHTNQRSAQHAIIPDIHAYNYPSERQRINDSGASTTDEAFFEIKTMTPCRSRYGHANTDTTAAERRAKAICVNYHKRFKKLDEVFVSDGSNPFETAQGRFLTGQVIPLVVGAFGDVNEALEKVLKQVAKAAAATTDGLTISPLINTDRKGGAFRIMHQQFRRAIGCATVRGQAKLTLGRLHYVRATREEAASVCKSHHSDNRWAPSQRGRSSWFNDHTATGYTTFEQFRNGHYYTMPH